MRDLFMGYYKPASEEIEKLWESSIIVFDANALLNVYSYSEQTRKTTLMVLESFQNRLWLPHQFALEYQKNRLSRISQETKNIADVKNKMRKLLDNEIKSLKRHPYLSDMQIKQLQEICETLNEAEKQHETLLMEDPFQEKIADIFKNKVGTPPDDDKKKKFCKEGKRRYERNIPPGYCDYNEKDEESNTYGDYIGWKELISHAKENTSDVILVTDDFKEDWWLKVRGKRVGPRAELISEFNTETDGRIIHIYSVSSFLSQASERVDIEISSEVIEEARVIPSSIDVHTKRRLPSPKKEEADAPKSSSKDKAERDMTKTARDTDAPKPI